MTFQRQETTKSTTPCPVQLLHVCHSKSLQKRLQESEDLFWVFCHRNKVLFIIQFQSIMQGKWSGNLHSSLQGCRRMTSAVPLHFPAKLQDQQQPQNWEALTALCTRCCILKVSSCTFRLKYTLTDICLNQLFEYQFCSCTKGKLGDLNTHLSPTSIGMTE